MQPPELPPVILYEQEVEIDPAPLVMRPALLGGCLVLSFMPFVGLIVGGMLNAYAGYLAVIWPFALFFDYILCRLNRYNIEPLAKC